MIRVEYVIESWRSVRQDTIAAVEDFPAGEFDYRPVEGVMTFGETARHILAAGEGLTKFLLAGVEDFSGPEFREKMKAEHQALPANPAQEWLAAELRQSMERIAAQLAAQTPEFYAGMVTRMDRARITRLEMVQSIKEHEMTHRSQLFFCLRMKGIVPATTRRRMAQQAVR
ncbi:MAG TPA: DinB family protein [Bryobacteraceae bacterium]|jgi:uncharacterized damage-inducible protein DinB|nr:DinB family protein [Bryobacteraceae bacterium]